MNSNRPVNLDLLTIRLPLPAYVSILHRISGILLFVGVGLLLYALDLSLRSEQEFERITAVLTSGSLRFLLWLTLSGLIYHLVAGIKHLLMDIGIGEEGGASGTVGSVLTLLISIVLIALAGVWLW